MIPYGRQNISQNDIDAVIEVLKSDFLTQGPVVPKFESLVRNYVSAKYAFAVNSATSGLHIACLALGVKPGDYVWTSPVSFVASANCALYCGATIDFIDINPETYNLDTESLKEKLQLAEKEGKLPSVLVAVHLAGQSCDMKKISELSSKYGFKVIEDASHAIGGKYLDKMIGSCEYSDISVFSFHPVKIITTGEGGMVTTNNPDLAVKLYRLRSHGITRDPLEMTHPPDGSWYYQQIELGFNYRMTDIQAALGISQLARIDEFIAERHSIVSIYEKKLANIELVLPKTAGYAFSSFHLFIVRLKEKNSLGITRNELFNRLRSKGILVNIHYIPIYRQPFHLGKNFHDFPESEKYYSEAISLPIYPGLTEEEIEFVCDSIITPLGYQTLF